jgi:hypothetical protein
MTTTITYFLAVWTIFWLTKATILLIKTYKHNKKTKGV